MLMNFKNPFKRSFFKSQPESETTSTAEQSTDWDTLTELNSDTSKTSFDDLAEVPFAGVASVTDGSVTLQNSHSESPIESIDMDNVAEQNAEISSPELQAFKNFFKTDLRIKRELMQAAPQPSDDYDESSRMEYVEDAYRTFKDFRSDFASISRDFQFGPAVDDATDDFFQRGTENFALSRYNSGVTEKIYRDEFTDLRPSFVEEVKDKCVGYTFGSDLGALIEDSQTINELLHAYHSHIMNSDQILQKVPVIAKKENDYGYSIALRGDETAFSRQIFDALPDNLDVGDTDIIGADEHVMMMVRDRGHALTLSAEPDQAKSDQMWVEYNIPKLCNVEMIKALPGLSGYSQNGARGGFFADRDKLGTTIANFIGQVPMDSDMSKPGGTLYERGVTQ